MDTTKDIIIFETKDHEVRLSVSTDGQDVWLNREQLSELFGRDIKTIGKHINTALKEELDNSTVAKFATVQTEGTREVDEKSNLHFLQIANSDKPVAHYSLDVK